MKYSFLITCTDGKSYLQVEPNEKKAVKALLNTFPMLKVPSRRSDYLGLWRLPLHRFVMSYWTFKSWGIKYFRLFFGGNQFHVLFHWDCDCLFFNPMIPPILISALPLVVAKLLWSPSLNLN